MAAVFAVIAALARGLGHDIAIGSTLIISAIVVVIIASRNGFTAVALGKAGGRISWLIRGVGRSAPWLRTLTIAAVFGVVKTAARSLGHDVTVGIALIVSTVVVVIVASGNRFTPIAGRERRDVVSGLVVAGGGSIVVSCVPVIIDIHARCKGQAEGGSSECEEGTQRGRAATVFSLAGCDGIFRFHDVLVDWRTAAIH